MTSIRKIFAVGCTVLLVISAAAALVLFNLDRTAFRAGTYKQVLVARGFYDQIPEVLAEAVSGGTLDESQLPAVMHGLSTRAWTDFFRAMLPQRTLYALGNQTLDSIFAYLNMQTDSAQMSLAPLKESLRSDAGVTAVYGLLNGQPDCSLVQVAQMTINLVTAKDIQLCNPPDELHPLLTPLIAAQMNITALALPDQITLASAQNLRPVDDPRTKLRLTRTLMRFSPFLPLGLLLLLTLLAVNSLESWLEWWGIPLFTTGLIAAIFSLSGAPLLSIVLRRIISQRGPAVLPRALSNYATDLAAAIVNALTRPILTQGLILAGIGLAMFLLAKYLGRRQARRPGDPAEAKTIV